MFNPSQPAPLVPAKHERVDTHRFLIRNTTQTTLIRILASLWNAAAQAPLSCFCQRYLWIAYEGSSWSEHSMTFPERAPNTITTFAKTKHTKIAQLYGNTLWLWQIPRPKSNLGRKRFSQLISSIVHGSRQELQAGTEAEAVEEWMLLTGFPPGFCSAVSYVTHSVGAYLTVD